MSGGGGSSNRHGSGAGIILEGLNNVALPQSLCFKFKATNNHAEYEVVLAGLRLAKEVGGRRVKCQSDSPVAPERINKVFQVKDPQFFC